MTVGETAKKIGISTSKVYQLAAARKIGHYRIGSKLLFQDDDVAAFLAGCRIAAAPSEIISRPPRLKLKHLRLDRDS